MAVKDFLVKNKGDGFPAGIPPLNPGDHLTRAEFHRRYLAHPEIKKAELIEGVVYMPSPVHFKHHGAPHFDLITWLGVYCAATPGVEGGDNASVLLDFENEPQPDILLRYTPEHGGQSWVNEDDYIEGTPELVVEVAASSVTYDMNVKRRVYARNGVPEYLAVQMYERRIDWFVLREGVYETLQPDKNSIIKSEIFPGLWLNTTAFWQRDLAQVLATLQQGLSLRG